MRWIYSILGLYTANHSKESSLYSSTAHAAMQNRNGSNCLVYKCNIRIYCIFALPTLHYNKTTELMKYLEKCIEFPA